MTLASGPSMPSTSSAPPSLWPLCPSRRIGWLRTLWVWVTLSVGPLLAQLPDPIVVGCDRNFPPYEYVDAQGQPTGFNVALIQALASEMGLRVQIRAGLWEETRRDFQAGKIHVLSGLFHSEARAREVGFSVPHSFVSYAIFVRKNGPRPTEETSLRGLRVLVQQGDLGQEYLEGRGIAVHPVPSPEDALRALHSGQGDCAVVPKAVGLHVIQRDRLRAVSPSGTPLLVRKYCFAVARSQAELLSRLNEGLFILRASGRYEEIAARHFPAIGKVDMPFLLVLKRAAIVLVPALVLLLGVGAWSWTLRRMVQQRTRSLREELRQRQRVEASLARSEERYRLLTEHSVDCICELDEAGRYRFVNARYQTLLGHSPEALLGRTAREVALVHPEDLERLEDHLAWALSQGTPAPVQYRARNHEGTWFWFERCTNRYTTPAGAQRLVSVARDITAQRDLEEGMRQTQKLESLGVLAGGIAHDFNNLLTAILGNLGLARLHLEEGHPGQPFLHKTELTALRAADLTRQMLAYGGRGSFLVATQDLNAVVQEITHLLAVSIPKKVALKVHLAPGELPFEADIAQIQQVVMNLVTNAAEAIGDAGGTITLTTLARHLAAPELARELPGQALDAGDYVVLDVRDTGIGMSQDTQARIFDPFFTTKRTGRGLGLSAMLGILRGHRAGIHLESQPGLGTRFTVFFRASEARAPSTSATLTPRQVSHRGTVLVVDDEVAIAEATCAALELMGFEVLMAHDGVEAVDKVTHFPGPIRLVIMDLTMPRMDGKEAFHALRALRPNLKVLLCSGYSEHESIQETLEAGLSGFLPKPFRLAELQAALQKVLEDSPVGREPQ